MAFKELWKVNALITIISMVSICAESAVCDFSALAEYDNNGLIIIWQSRYKGQQNSFQIEYLQFHKVPSTSTSTLTITYFPAPFDNFKILHQCVVSEGDMSTTQEMTFLTNAGLSRICWSFAWDQKRTFDMVLAKEHVIPDNDPTPDLSVCKTELQNQQYFFMHKKVDRLVNCPWPDGNYTTVITDTSNQRLCVDNPTSLSSVNKHQVIINTCFTGTTDYKNPFKLTLQCLGSVSGDLVSSKADGDIVMLATEDLAIRADKKDRRYYAGRYLIKGHRIQLSLYVDNEREADVPENSTYSSTGSEFVHFLFTNTAAPELTTEATSASATASQPTQPDTATATQATTPYNAATQATTSSNSATQTTTSSNSATQATTSNSATQATTTSDSATQATTSSNSATQATTSNSATQATTSSNSATQATTSNSATQATTSNSATQATTSSNSATQATTSSNSATQATTTSDSATQATTSNSATQASSSFAFQHTTASGFGDQTTETPGLGHRVRLVLNGDYNQMIDGNEDVFVEAVLPQLASAANVSHTRIEKVIFLPGSNGTGIILAFTISSGIEGAATPSAAAHNIELLVSRCELSLLGPKKTLLTTTCPEFSSFIIPPDNPCLSEEEGCPGGVCHLTSPYDYICVCGSPGESCQPSPAQSTTWQLITVICVLAFLICMCVIVFICLSWART